MQVIHFHNHLKRAHPGYAKAERQNDPIDLDELDKKTLDVLKAKYQIIVDPCNLANKTLPELDADHERLLKYVNAWHDREYGSESYRFSRWLKSHMQKVFCSFYTINNL